ncbi:MAG: hypothetical protein ABI624_14635 [Casimicrobiaceae bacterium]
MHWLLYLYRSGQLRSLADVRAMVRGILRAAASAFDQLTLTMLPYGMPSSGFGRDTERDGLEPLDMLAAGR